MSALESVLADLGDLGDRLDQVVAGCAPSQWATLTPAPGWSVAHQIAHLAWTDEVALLAAQAHVDKEPWDAVVLQAMGNPEGFVDDMAALGATEAPDELLQRRRGTRVALAQALRELPDGVKMPWFGPPMSATSMATARLMETWAHSLDCHEALGASFVRTDAVQHIAHLGVRTRNYAFSVHGLQAPAEEFYVHLTLPSQGVLTWGAESATQTVRGSAFNFALLVTQRRHRDDLDLSAVGPDASRWLDIAQAFAGPPGVGRAAS